MEKIKKEIKSEIRHLPFALGKLVGGAMAAIGSTGVIVVVTRKPDPSYLDILPYLILGIIGVSFFLLSSRLLEKRMNNNTGFMPTTREKKPISIVSWMIFLIFISSCIVISYIMTR